MCEIVGAFLRAELWDERANCARERRDRSSRDLAEERLEFAVRQLDRIEVRRVFRQVAQARPRFLNCFSNGGSHVNSTVIHDDDVIALERGNQALLDVGEEHLSFMAPSITIGAVILSWRKAATKVIVSHAPSGTVPITLTPLGARPLRRARLVLTAVSSINTSRAGSSIPCSRIQSRRARATSSRCRSAACRLFFKSDVVATEKTPERTATGSNSPLAQLCNRFYQGQVWLLSNESENLGRELFQRRNASARAASAQHFSSRPIAAATLLPRPRLSQSAPLLLVATHLPQPHR